MTDASRDLSPSEPLVRALESASILDAPATLFSRAVRGMLSPGALKDALSGTRLGHALHPALTDLVIGSFMSATVLDLLGEGRRSRASERLILLGVAAYLPTAASGASDWIDAESDTRVKRIGFVHAAGNNITMALYVTSLAARRRGAPGRATVLSALGATTLSLAGFLGGHLTLRRGVGPDQTVFDPGPGEWRPAVDASGLTPGRPLRVVVEDTPVLVIDAGEEIFAIHDRCSHRGCSLAEGEVEGHEIVCGCHFSRFDLRDGSVLRGPATAPQPAFEVRRRENLIEIRLRASG